MNKILLAIFVIVTGTAVGYFIHDTSTTPSNLNLDTQAPTGGDFTLAGEDGPVNLKDYRGQVVLIYFGYTFCPDICPTSLALMTQALNALTEQELGRVQPIFVSVDPERDTPAKLARYTDYFHPKILGVTGTAESIAEVARRYGAVYRKVEGESQGGYLVDHSSVTHLVSADGVLRQSLPHGALPTKILEAVRAELRAGSRQ